jgi:hypothetical protein
MHILAKESQDSENKIDAVMAGVLAEEVRGDWIAAGRPDPPKPKRRIARSFA